MAEAILGIAGMILALGLFVGVIFLGIWMDGRRQAARSKDLHPVTTPEGDVVTKEQEQVDGDPGHNGT